MDELATIASHRVVGDLSAVMMEAVARPTRHGVREPTWPASPTRSSEWSPSTTRPSSQPSTGGATRPGNSARDAHDARRGAHLIASELEKAWRVNFDCNDPFDEATAAAQLAHARLAIDDVIADARQVTGAGPTEHQLIARTLGLRLFAGWCGYVLEMNTRMNVPIPQLGGPTLSSPISLS